ncbi:sulfotransferase [Dongia deserti]|uniref:sulfotransferase n=1 Tax=Dongia deserti TaxID=2268030 RepID=UPI000E64A2AE|nr:sulfotransferase [Dongia deserti]
MDQQSPTKYLYIVGRGYSGSTIFSLLLGQSSAVENEGEIVFGFRPGFEGRRCVQRDLFMDCPFWAEVKRDFERRTDSAFADAVTLLYRRAHFLFAIPNLLASSRSAKVLETKRLATALYDSISEASNRPVVLDASKEMATAVFLLRHVDGVKFIHFVRNPFGVVDSYVKRIKRDQRFDMFRLHLRLERHYFIPIVISALVWTLQNLFWDLLRLLYPKKIIRLRYEDLCDGPVALLEAVEQFAGVSLAGSKAAATEKREMKLGHALQGNRTMWRGDLVFEPRKGLPQHLTSFDKAVIVLCTFPLMLAYGYLGWRIGKRGRIQSASDAEAPAVKPPKAPAS